MHKVTESADKNEKQMFKYQTDLLLSMTIIRDFDRKCAACGKTSPQPALMSTNTWGYPDLDLRPAPMQRDTMSTWLDECPYCGYVASNIEIEIELPKDFLKSDEYLTCEGNEFKSDLSKRFYRNYLISKANGDHESEFQSLLYCAWTCDDAEDELAVKVRKLALKSMDNTDAESADEKRNLLLMRIDLLRRSLQFERVIEEFKDFKDDDEVFYSIIRFQLKLAVNEDSGCYTVEDVVKEFNLDSE